MSVYINLHLHRLILTCIKKQIQKRNSRVRDINIKTWSLIVNNVIFCRKFQNYFSNYFPSFHRSNNIWHLPKANVQQSVTIVIATYERIKTSISPSYSCPSRLAPGVVCSETRVVTVPSSSFEPWYRYTPEGSMFVRATSMRLKLLLRVRY